MDYSKIITKEYVENELRIHNVPGIAIGVIKDGEQIMAEGFGYADIEKKTPISANTMFGIASCTKSFTSALVGMLVDEGKIEYDKPIIEYLPDFRLYDDYATKTCTIRDMLNHRTGLPGHDALWVDEIDRAELYRRLRYVEPNAPIRTVTQYNNTVYTIIGYIVERITGESWHDLIRTRIFEPLGMNHSNTTIEELRKCDDIAEPHWRIDGKVRKIKNWDVSLGAPCAGINTCLNDFLKWIQFHLNNGKWEGKQIISEEVMKEMHTAAVPFQMWGWELDEVPPIAFYCMGWFSDGYRGEDLVFHAGEIEGYCTMQAFLPKRNIGVVLMINNHNSSILIEQSIFYTILDNLLGFEPVNWSKIFADKIGKWGGFYLDEMVNMLPDPPVAGTAPSHDLEMYAGHYYNKGYGDFVIKVVDGQLVGVYRGTEQPMTHYHYDTFKVPNIKADVLVITAPLTFHINPFDGSISEFEIPLEPAVSPILFQRI